METCFACVCACDACGDGGDGGMVWYVVVWWYIWRWGVVWLTSICLLPLLLITASTPLRAYGLVRGSGRGGYDM